MVDSLVVFQLPSRMEASDAVGVGEQLAARFLAVTAPKKNAVEGAPVHVTVPAAVSASWKRFAASHDTLAQATALRLAMAPAAAPTEEPDAANAASDAGWRTFERWLGGWSQHPDDGKSPTGADAAALYARVFPAEDAMRFITWRPRKQWVAMQGRMAILAEPASRDVVNGLGGARLYDALVATHEAFGRAYGFTRAQADASAPTADVRSAFMAAKDALRGYATRVEASADPDVPGSEALAAWLLAPLHAMVAEFAAAPTKRATPDAEKRTPSQPPPAPNA
jgi:hypothetical protein